MASRLVRSALGTWILASLLVSGVALGRWAPDPHRETALVTAPHPTLPDPLPTLPDPLPTPPPAPSTTTTTTAPPPPPTVAPTTTAPARRAPAPAPVAAPVTVAPPPMSEPAAPAPAGDATAYAMELVRSVVPGRWLAAVPVYVEVIPGNTSWSSYGGLIEIGDWHLFDSEARARFVLAHEWGHQAAWRFGPDTYDGQPPAGFPGDGSSPEEQWADCVAEVLTGMSGGCPTAGFAFTARWIAAGPP